MKNTKAGRRKQLSSKYLASLIYGKEIEELIHRKQVFIISPADLPTIDDSFSQPLSNMVELFVETTLNVIHDSHTIIKSIPIDHFIYRLEYSAPVQNDKILAFRTIDYELILTLLSELVTCTIIPWKKFQKFLAKYHQSVKKRDLVGDIWTDAYSALDNLLRFDRPRRPTIKSTLSNKKIKECMYLGPS
jgi:hypothetical protein